MSIQPKRLELAELIERLRTENPAKRVRLGFTHPHSYRGYYEDLAFETCESITIGEMLTATETALNTTYEGWKGGDYTMDAHTDCWLVTQEGTSTGEPVGALLLEYMLADTVPPDTPRGKSYSELLRQ